MGNGVGDVCIGGILGHRIVPAGDADADFSHWVVVAERLLEDCADILSVTFERTIHLHARVGYAEALAAHERWWDAIWASQRRRGMVISTLTPEFGPAGYMHTLPFTNQPVANLPEVCDWIATRQRERLENA